MSGSPDIDAAYWKERAQLEHAELEVAMTSIDRGTAELRSLRTQLQQAETALSEMLFVHHGGYVVDDVEPSRDDDECTDIVRSVLAKTGEPDD